MHKSPYSRERVPRRVRRHLLLFVGGAALLVAGLGLASTSARFNSAAAAETPQAQTTGPRANTPQTTARVFFVRGQRFVPRTRVVDLGESSKAMAMRALLAGPTTIERRSGINTTIPRRTSLASLRVKDGVTTIALSQAPSKTTASEISARPARAAQIVYTLTASTKVQKVLIKINGHPWAGFAASRLTIKDPRGRSDLTKPIKLPNKAALVPRGPAPADARASRSDS